MSPTSTEEVEDTISSFYLNKALGPKSVPMKILKDLKEELSKPLTILMNLTFSFGIFPNCLKIAKGDQQECNNYRPISLLSNISKQIEKLLNNHLYSFFEQNNCLFNYQFGFRNHALISITEKIRKVIDDGKFVCGVFLDFKKAFNTVNHQILISKLEHYGVRGVPLNFFKSYLENRKQFVSVNNINSDILPTEYGVPQGSVLGPLLFQIRINDLNNAVEFSNVHHFAHDTNVLYSIKSPKDIYKKISCDLKNVIMWLRVNKILLNADKTQLALFKSKKEKSLKT